MDVTTAELYDAIKKALQAAAELLQERVGGESRLSIDACYGAYWELIPQGSPGHMEYEDPWSGCHLLPGI